MLEIISTKARYLTTQLSTMFPNAETRRSSQSSFSITIKINTLEARRRLQNQYGRSFRSQREIRRLVARVDADHAFWKALVALEVAIEEAYGELQWGQLPERVFLADGTLSVERVYPKIKALLRDLETADRSTQAQEGLTLRTSRLVIDIEETSDTIEEMRTQLLKELAGPATDLGGKTWKRALAGFFGRKQDTSRVKRAEEAHPYTRQLRLQPTVHCQYYL